MQIGRISTALPTHLGQLLVNSGIISHSALEESLTLSKQLRMPTGHVMIIAGFITQRTLESVLFAQSMIRQNMLNIDSAVSLLRDAHRSCISFEETLAAQGWKSNSPTVVSELGDLLVSATMISRQELTLAVKTIANSGESLSRYLLGRKMIRSFDIMNALRAFAMVKQDEMSQPDAVLILRTAVAGGISFEQALVKSQKVELPARQCIKIGDLLSMSGIVCDIDLIDAIEQSLTRNVMVGEVLIESEKISRYVLHAALELQQMLYNRTLNLRQARELLLKVHNSKTTLEQCLSDLEIFCASVVGLLLDAGLITNADIDKVRSQPTEQVVDVAELLYDNEVIDRTQLDIARRCQRMVNEQFVGTEQAVQVLAAYNRPAHIKPNIEVTACHGVMPVDMSKYPEPEIFDSLAASHQQ